jgi:O-antigen/teichoic acid export membrane protein
MPIKSILRIFVAEVLSKLILGLSHIVIIKGLPITEFGRFSYLYATAFAAANFSGVALNRAMMVQAAKAAPAGRPLLMGAMMSCLGAALLLIVVGVAGSYGAAEVTSLAVFVSGYLVLDYLRTQHQSELRFVEYSGIEIARSTLILLATFAALRSAGPVEGVGRAPELLMASQGAVMLLMAIPWVLWVRRAKIALRLSASFSAWRSCLSRHTVALTFYFAAVGLLGQTEVFVLRRFGTTMDLAVFSAAFRYYSLLLLATGAVGAVLTPMSQRTETAYSFLDLLRKGRLYFLLFGGVALASIPALYLVRELLGVEKYPGFFVVYAVLCLASIQGVFLSPHVSALMRLDDHTFLNALAYGVIAMSICCCVVLVRGAGALGAAISYCVANTVLNGLAYRRAHHLIVAVPQHMELANESSTT